MSARKIITELHSFALTKGLNVTHTPHTFFLKFRPSLLGFISMNDCKKDKQKIKIIIQVINCCFGLQLSLRVRLIKWPLLKMLNHLYGKEVQI